MVSHRLEFGVSLTPVATDAVALRRAAVAADEHGLDLIGVQDHPYVDAFLDTMTLIAVLLEGTQRVRVFPDVLSLPLRPPAMLAKAAASQHVLSGGRFELGLGAGAFWGGIRAMGGPERSPREAVDALEEAVGVLRQAFGGVRAVRHHGAQYTLAGWRPGPAVDGPVPIWIGAVGRRMLELTGRLSDGWAAPIPKYMAFEQLGAAQARIDAGARAAGRPPEAVRRMAQIPGTIDDAVDTGPPHGDASLDGPPERWIETLAHLAVDLRFDTFVLWPRRDPEEQIARFAREVVPAVRERAGRPAPAAGAAASEA